MLVLRGGDSPVVGAGIAVCRVDESWSGSEEEDGLEDIAELHGDLLFGFYLSWSKKVLGDLLEVGND